MNRTEAAKVLGVRVDASEEEVNAAYKKMAKKHHPDLGGDTRSFQMVLEAKEILLKKSTTSEDFYVNLAEMMRQKLAEMEVEMLARRALNSAELAYGLIMMVIISLGLFVFSGVIGILFLIPFWIMVLKKKKIVEILSLYYLQKHLKNKR